VRDAVRASLTCPCSCPAPFSQDDRRIGTPVPALASHAFVSHLRPASHTRLFIVPSIVLFTVPFTVPFTAQPENILCGERMGDIKIADFGLSKLVLPDEIMKMPCGTLSYVAPEVSALQQ
jgi:serine/threonine protein kinase